MSLNKTSVAIGVVALVVIVAAVALAMGAGDDGGDGPERVQQDYWMELTEHVGGFDLDIRLNGASPGSLTVYVGDEVLLNRIGEPVYVDWGTGERVHLSDLYYFSTGQDFEYIQDNLRIEFDVPSYVDLVRH